MKNTVSLHVGGEEGSSEMEKVGLLFHETDGRAMFPGAGCKGYACVEKEQPA